jgi:hypothetical protein
MVELTENNKNRIGTKTGTFAYFSYESKNICEFFKIPNSNSNCYGYKL